MGRSNVECGTLEGVSDDTWKWGGRCPNASGGVARLTRGYPSNAVRAVRLARVDLSRAVVPLAVLGGGWTIVVLAATFNVDSFHAPGLRAVLETMMTLFALAAAWLLRAEFMSSRRVRDLLLLGAVLGLGLINLWAAALPAALSLPTGVFFSGAELWGQLAVGALFAAAAFTRPDRLAVRSTKPIATTALLGLAVMTVAGLGGLLVGAPGTARPFLFILALGATAPLLCAAAEFARQSSKDGDRAAALLTGAMLLLAGGSLADLTTRALSPGRIGADEALRVLASALLLAAAVTFERRERRRLARSAALAERRRVARDLHDGLAQDLAFIAAHGRTISAEMGDDHPVVVAARRALAISRSAISELTDPERATARECLEAVAQELRERFDVKIAVHSQLDVDLEPHAREQVSRIAREAIANAARHGRARKVIVSLERTGRGVELRVVDDGCGITEDDGDSIREGFGLTSMRERAAALGGYLRVGPARRGGTELEVVLP
jgi:signal transduction histidine kinase